MKTFKYQTFYGEFIVRLSVHRYSHGDTLAVSMENFDPEEDDPHAWEPFAAVTVNLPESRLLPKNCAFLDENNLPGIRSWLIQNGLAEPFDGKPRVAASGFCLYPAVRFFPDKF